MVPMHPSRVRSQSPVRRRLMGIVAATSLASAAVLPSVAQLIHGQSGIHAIAATRAVPASYKSQVQQSRIQQKIAEDKRQLALEENRLDALLHAPANGSRSIAETPESPELLTVRELRAQLTEKRKHLAELQENYTDLYPDVITTREEIAELQSKLEQAQTAVHTRTAPAARVQTTAGRDQELAKIRAAIEQRTRELAIDEASASRSIKQQPVRSSVTAPTSPQTTPPARQSPPASNGPAAIPEQPSASVPFAPVKPVTSSADSSAPVTPSGSRLAVPLLIAFVMLAAAIGWMMRLRAKNKSQAGILQDSAQLKALLPDMVLIGSIPKMKPQ